MSDSKEIPCVFETADVLGNYIFLTVDTWEQHIKPEHLYMAGEEKKVKKTIENPDFIYKDKDISTTYNYYSIISSTRLRPFGNFLKVSAGIDNGNVKTAYVVDKIVKKENLIYKKK
ncbi:MAG: hypothetical protein AB1521_04740 [Bacteroidota bacterium]